MALAHCILGKYLGVGCHCFPPPLDIRTFSARCLHVRHERPLAAEGETHCGREVFWQLSCRIQHPRNSRDILHAANLRHGTDGFTSPPKEGVLRIFSHLKIQRLRLGLNPRTWVPKASTLPLDHRSRSHALHAENYIPIASAKHVFKNGTSVPLICTRLSENIYCVKRTMAAIRGKGSKFCLPSTYILISSQCSLFCARIVRILGITFCPVY